MKRKVALIILGGSSAACLTAAAWIGKGTVGGLVSLGLYLLTGLVGVMMYEITK